MPWVAMDQLSQRLLESMCYKILIRVRLLEEGFSLDWMFSGS